MCLNDGVAVRQGCSSPQADQKIFAPRGSSCASSRMPRALALNATPCAMAVPLENSATAESAAASRIRDRAAAGQGMAPARATKATGGMRSQSPQVFINTCGQSSDAPTAARATSPSACRPCSSPAMPRRESHSAVPRTARSKSAMASTRGSRV